MHMNEIGINFEKRERATFTTISIESISKEILLIPAVTLFQPFCLAVKTFPNVSGLFTKRAHS